MKKKTESEEECEVRCHIEGGQGDPCRGGSLIKASLGSRLYLQACSPNDSHLQLVRASTHQRGGRVQGHEQGLCVRTHGEKWINKTTKLCMSDSDTLVLKKGKTTSKNKTQC